MTNIKKYKYRIPIIGRILKDRDTLQIERNDLLKLIQYQPKKQTDFKKLSAKYSKNISDIKKYLKNKKQIFDIGTGPIGSGWWRDIDTGSQITGIDYFFFPDTVPDNVSIFRFDASKLNNIKSGMVLEKYLSPDNFTKQKINWDKRFDLVVANHVLEHVENPEKLIEGIGNIIKKNGVVHVGFPDYRNFTDIFYHVVHPNGGGHIQQLTNDSVEKIFKKNGFKLIECNIWPDDWVWFQSCYDPVSNGNHNISHEQINNLCKIFRKELTPEKGYFYGWQMIFEKIL